MNKVKATWGAALIMTIIASFIFGRVYQLERLSSLQDGKSLYMLCNSYYFKERLGQWSDFVEPCKELMKEKENG